MKTTVRIAIGCGILAMDLAFSGAAPASAQVRFGGAAAQDPWASTDQKTAPDLILVGDNVALLEVLPWDLPDVAGGCVAPANRQLPYHRSHRRAVVPFGNRSHGRLAIRRAGGRIGVGFRTAH